MLAQPHSPFHPAGMPSTSAAGKRVRWADGESIRRCMTPGPEVARPPTTRRPSYSKPHPYKIWVPDASQFPDSDAKPSPIRSSSSRPAAPTSTKAPTMPAGVAYGPPKVPLRHASLAASISRPSTAPLPPPAPARTPLMANNVNAPADASPSASPKARARQQHEFWYPGAHTVQPEHSTDCRKCWLTRLNAYSEGGVMDGTLTCSRHS